MSENREMSVRSEMGHLELATSKMVALLEKLHAYVGGCVEWEDGG